MTMRRRKAVRRPPAVPVTVIDVESTHLATVGSMDVLQRAVRDGASVDVLERLLGLHERWEATQARKAFDAAMAALRVDFPAILKTREVDFVTSKGRTNYRYEDLSSVTDVVAPALARQGLTFRWQTDSSHPGVISVTCIVSHVGGHSERTMLSAGIDQTGNKNDIQAIGSAVTYLQRYTLKAALGIAASMDADSRVVESPKGRGRPPAETDESRTPARDITPAAHHGKVDEPITEQQLRRLWTIARGRGRTDNEVKVYLAGRGLDSSKAILRRDYDTICIAMEHPGPLVVARDPGQDG